MLALNFIVVFFLAILKLLLNYKFKYPYSNKVSREHILQHCCKLPCTYVSGNRIKWHQWLQLSNPFEVMFELKEQTASIVLHAFHLWLNCQCNPIIFPVFSLVCSNSPEFSSAGLIDEHIRAVVRFVDSIIITVITESPLY